LGGNVAEDRRACWLTLRHALEGLRDIPGRKFVVVFSPNLGSPGARDPVVKELALDANAAMAAVYAVDPRGPVAADSAGPALPPLAALARDTGGAFGVDLSKVLQAERVYAIGSKNPTRIPSSGVRRSRNAQGSPRGRQRQAPSGYMRVEARQDSRPPSSQRANRPRWLRPQGADIPPI
jgi:hypothetical protein